MKIRFKVILLILINCSLFLNTYAQVGINNDNSTPDASAMLDVKATDKGMLIPRLTTSQRNLISTPATGLLIYNSTTNSFNFYNGIIWTDLSSGVVNQIADTDNDTKIQVEKNADEDIIRFSVDTSEVLQIKKNPNGVPMLSINSGINGNTMLGENAGRVLNPIWDEQGTNNTFIGYQAGYNDTIGENNVYLGTNTGYLNENGIGNVFLGALAGESNIGDINTFIGAGAGNNATGNFNIFIGYNTGYDAIGDSKLYIDNTLSTGSTPLIWGDFEADIIKIYGTLGIKDAYQFPIVDGTAGQVLKTDGSGEISWENENISTDNLGNHTATTNVQLNGNYINNDGGNEGLQIDDFGAGTIVSNSARPLLIQHNTYGNGSYIEINNSSGTRALFGVDGNGFSGGDTTDIVVGNWSDGDLALFTNADEKMRITAAGRVGIGRTAVTNILEVNGQASKISAGSWVANSDARLKKNITPLSSEQMLNNLLALKGVTYEWNDTTTGNDRPTGIQYGFTAQNIQTVFPTLVEEDGLGYLQTAYGTYDAMTVEAIRALNDKIEQQNNIIQKQNEKIEVLENQTAKINQLESLLLELQQQVQANFKPSQPSSK